MFAQLEAIRDHEEAHVAALTAAIADRDGEPVVEQTYDFGYEDAAGFLEVAIALENTGVAAYAGAAPAIMDETLLAAALGIHSVEARHAAYLNTLNGETAFPDAVDAAMTRDEVLDAAGGFIAAEGGATAGTGGAVEVEVEIDDYEFIPPMLEIAAGTSVTFTNIGGVVHTATADDDSFDTDTLRPGAGATITFDEPGEFPYFCLFHPSSMRGTVVVG